MVNPHIVRGSGARKVLVLHGWFGDAKSWQPIFDLLDGDRFSYAFMDYRGYGDAMELDGDFTLDEIAADALALADSLGWEQFAVVGHSMGGAAAQRLLATAPDRVTKLVGISPVPASGIPFDEQGWALFSGAPEAPGNRRAIIDITTGNRLTGRWLDSMVEYSLAHSRKDAFAAYLTAWAQADFASEIAGKTLPVKLIVGAHDPAIGEATVTAAVLPNYPNGDLEVFADAGHYAMNETPIQLVSALEAFLAA